MDLGTGRAQEIESESTEAAALGVSGRYAVWETESGRVLVWDTASQRILRVTEDGGGTSPVVEGSAVAWTSAGSRLMWRGLPSGSEQMVADRDDSLWLQPVAAFGDGGAVWLEISGERPGDRRLVAKGWGDEPGLQVLVHRSGSQLILSGCVANDQMAAWVETIRGDGGAIRGWELWCRRADERRSLRLAVARRSQALSDSTLLCVNGREVLLALRQGGGEIVRAYGAGAPRTVLSLNHRADLLACDGSVAAWSEDAHTLMVRCLDD